jgi:hypothetical protein
MKTPFAQGHTTRSQTALDPAAARPSGLRAVRGGRLAVALFSAGVAVAATAGTGAVIWRFEDVQGGGRPAPTVLGNPRPVIEDGRKALRFNGESDGLILAQNPIEGRRTFTIEVLFKPDDHAPPAQRFVHLEDSKLNRALIETRVTPDGHWYLDTYLHTGATDKGVTLVDREKLHPCNRWYWAALVYDGKVMSHFVNGAKEKEGVIDFGPMAEGRTSVGVRLNQVFWFKGAIAEVRFHSRAVPAGELQRTPERQPVSGKASRP